MSDGPKTAKKKPTCIVPDCSEPVKTRGLCARCYAAAAAKVKAGDITWEKLIELQLARPSQRETGAKDAFNEALAKALQGNSAQPDGSQEKAPEKEEKTTKAQEPKAPVLPWKAG